MSGRADDLDRDARDLRGLNYDQHGDTESTEFRGGLKSLAICPAEMLVNEFGVNYGLLSFRG